MSKAVFEIDGTEFETLGGFFDVVGRTLIPGATWGRNLDAFHDILRGGFGTPQEGLVIRWKNSAVSRERLGYEETDRELERRLTRCHPSNRPHVAAELDLARSGVGPTVFDWLVNVIKTHCPGGQEESSGVELQLE